MEDEISMVETGKKKYTYDDYAKHGVREYWIVDPMERSIEVYANRDGEFKQVAFVKQKGRANSRLFSELTVSIPELFGM
jgi:Uma2 family endonuclease